MNNAFLKKEDYEEGCCPLDMHPEKKSIPIRRVTEKADEYYNTKDFSSAERHLEYWISEAEAINDLRGKLFVVNEQVGLYRKLNNKEKGITATKTALGLLKELGLEDTVTGGTTFLNVATAYKAFGMANDGYALYKKCKEIYEKQLPSFDYRLGGLYNNMALTCVELKDYSSAEKLYGQALEIMLNNQNCEGESAITYCNLADLVAQKNGLTDGEKIIGDYLEKAYSLLTKSDLDENGDYAFILEKCAPVFGYYGYFKYEWELNERAKRIYERS